MENNPRAARLKSQGDECFKAKNYSDASVFYSQAVAMDNNNPILYCNLAACWNALEK
jgi:TPR repeat